MPTCCHYKDGQGIKQAITIHHSGICTKVCMMLNKSNKCRATGPFDIVLYFFKSSNKFASNPIKVTDMQWILGHFAPRPHVAWVAIQPHSWSFISERITTLPMVTPCWLPTASDRLSHLTTLGVSEKFGRSGSDSVRVQKEGQTYLNLFLFQLHFLLVNWRQEFSDCLLSQFHLCVE